MILALKKNPLSVGSSLFVWIKCFTWSWGIITIIYHLYSSKWSFLAVTTGRERERVKYDSVLYHKTIKLWHLLLSKCKMCHFIDMYMFRRSEQAYDLFSPWAVSCDIHVTVLVSFVTDSWFCLQNLCGLSMSVMSHGFLLVIYFNSKLSIKTQIQGRSLCSVAW